IDMAVFDLGLLGRVGDPLDGDEDLHGDSFLTRPVVTSATTHSAARTISNFFGRVPGVPPGNVVRDSTHASASSSRTPKIIRAATCGGMFASRWPLSWAAATTPPSMRRKSWNAGLSY